ncbi:flagellar protein FliO/FliZ [Bradyrhizobium diazoefficiens]|uniref:Flagellar biosynthesis protein FliO n=1 Tax=Bradyrhizobium diazoefficiens TaxID=1355477 RepID=A0A810CWN3_9BRAD|nr:flagellar biosynthetic protein FliO [Bradyrhizobium diazoefficiens]WLA77003.1 flagellar biosynthetic protein FliO [Bradyrhizobium diazoefficiens]BCE23630.1 flagellar biosynthesis protein FliO [Bradyrhizobium diazoefficiens]BCE49890.1 flagellar biosynthesis protein FliO [Bradyrhizobium diazoefficiens]BCE93398.1 flagellar biosynthesis protein FliO [Bradyrhizobium diazoefficiens]BCF28334.1 flagellar biosynthesis protein FliO [Bradyrhizobium diazoefficiens]
MQGSPITFIVAFIVVLALIGVAAWLVRRFASSRLGANTQRGRMPRLAVIDAAAVDGRRRLVLVRRDNVEHLLMIGGPTDIVVEPNIVRAAPGRDQLPQRPNAAEPPRLAPMPDAGSWADEAPRPEMLDHPEPQMPEPPPRPARPSFADEVRRPAPALAERRSEPPLAGFPPEPIAPRPEREPRPEPLPLPPRVARSEPPLMPRPPRQSEPAKVPPVRAERAVAPPPPPVPQAPPVPPPPPAPAAPSSAEQNLAEMAQRLEAALRRPAGETVAPPVAPEPPAAPPRAARSEPPAPPAPPPKPAPEKTSFENLEDEMASLLGRPKPSS